MLASMDMGFYMKEASRKVAWGRFRSLCGEGDVAIYFVFVLFVSCYVYFARYWERGAQEGL